MNNHNDQTILDMLSMFDLTVGELYLAYAGIFPDDRTKWIGFAEEELCRAMCITLLKTYLGKKNSVNEGSSASLIQSINDAVAIIQKKIGEAEKGNVDLAQAINICLEIEYSDIRNLYPSMLVFSDIEAIKIRRRLTGMTRERQAKFILWLDHLDAMNNARRSMVA